MEVRIDAVGNVIGRYAGKRPAAAALLIGSHIDTVVDAGRFDGNLGVIAGIVTVGALNRLQQRYPFAIEVVAFGDEEGVRFPSAMLGSRAFAGTAQTSMLDGKDGSGTSLREALRALRDQDVDLGSALARSAYLAYLETHIEQGPVLEAENRPLGVVTAINGAARYRFEVAGTAGHAGTVPMELRRDALAGAAEMVVAIEAAARASKNIVATVGQLKISPGAVNVIAGVVRFTLDIRGPQDSVREAVTRRIVERAQAVARRRGLALTYERVHEAPAVRCDATLVKLLSRSVESIGETVRLIPSGAGHDAMVVAKICPVVMLFVRCAGGISHNPAESASVEDIDRAIRTMLAFLSAFAGQYRATTMDKDP